MRRKVEDDGNDPISQEFIATNHAAMAQTLSEGQGTIALPASGAVALPEVSPPALVAPKTSQVPAQPQVHVQAASKALGASRQKAA